MPVSAPHSALLDIPITAGNANPYTHRLGRSHVLSTSLPPPAPSLWHRTRQRHSARTSLLPREALACPTCWPLTRGSWSWREAAVICHSGGKKTPNQSIPLCCRSLSLPVMGSSTQSHLPALFCCKQVSCHPRNCVCEVIYEIFIPLACKRKRSKKPARY